MTRKNDLEVWQNTTRGSRWYKSFGVRGEVIDVLVAPGKVFSLTVDARKYNQQISANSRLDLFRNGDFVLKESSAYTVKEEVESKESLTDEEVTELILQVKHGDAKLGDLTADITSISTLERVADAAEANGVHHSSVSALRRRIEDATVGVAHDKLVKGKEDPAPPKAIQE